MTNWKERFWQKNMDRTRAAKDNEKQVIWEEYNLGLEGFLMMLSWLNKAAVSLFYCIFKAKYFPQVFPFLFLGGHP